MPPRDLYIDRLRTAMTALVIVFHAAITYGASGGWFYYELKPSASISSLLLTLFCGTQQAYFMSFFFLLAAYFTPGSLERKGYARFIGDRFLRLGLPLLAFGLLLAPITIGIQRFGDGESFWSAFQFLWQHHRFINGPLWFTQALLIFSLLYCAWRAVFGAPLSDTTRTPRKLPGARWWLLTALLTGAGALAIRQVVPAGENVIGLQLGYFATYIFLFAVGIAAWRYDWLRQLTWGNARTGMIAAAIAWPAIPIGIALAHKLYGPGKANFSGGPTWPAVLYAFWEPLVAWGVIALWLLVFRAKMNQPSPFWQWLNRRAYAVYIIHPPILVGVAVLFHPWVAPALIKWVVTASVAVMACWLVADPIVRLPGIRRVV